MIINYSSLTPVPPHGPNHLHVMTNSINDRFYFATGSRFQHLLVFHMHPEGVKHVLWHLDVDTHMASLSVPFIPVYLTFYVFGPNRRCCSA